jgi:aspartyl-tRNA(Asn)/glutamyl-tRNA(Gln) amidotransferase subunit C
MKLGTEQVRHIAWLARLGLTEAEVEMFSRQLSNILENFEILQEVDTTNVPLANHLGTRQNIFREDEAARSLPKDEILANAPRKEENCLKVAAILE